MLNLLGKLGFTTKSLDQYLKNYQDRVGDTADVQALADISKKVIAFAEGQETFENITEEVAHVAIEMYKDKNSILSLLAEVVNHAEYNEFAEQYRKKYSQKISDPVEVEDMVRREILGKILQRKISDKFSTENETPIQQSLIQKLFKLFTDFVTRIQQRYRPQHRTLFDKITDDIVNSISNEELDNFDGNIITQEDKIFYSLSPEEGKNFRLRIQELYDKISRNRADSGRSKLKIKIGRAHA